MATKKSTTTQELPLATPAATEGVAAFDPNKPHILLDEQQLAVSEPSALLTVAAPVPQRSYTLAELELEYAHILELVEESEGEITPELEEMLQVHEADRNKKLMGYYYLVTRFENEEEMVDREIKRLKLIKEQKKKRADLLKNHMLRALFLFGKDTGKAGKSLFKMEVQYGDSIITLGTRRSEAVMITSEDDLPAEYWRRPPVPDMEVDKVKIKEALGEGKEVPGAELKTNFSLTIK